MVKLHTHIIHIVDLHNQDSTLYITFQQFTRTVQLSPSTLHNVHFNKTSRILFVTWSERKRLENNIISICLQSLVVKNTQFPNRIFRCERATYSIQSPRSDLSQNRTSRIQHFILPNPDSSHVIKVVSNAHNKSIIWKFIFMQFMKERSCINAQFVT